MANSASVGSVLGSAFRAVLDNPGVSIERKDISSPGAARTFLTEHASEVPEDARMNVREAVGLLGDQDAWVGKDWQGTVAAALSPLEAEGGRVSLAALSIRRQPQTSSGPGGTLADNIGRGLWRAAILKGLPDGGAGLTDIGRAFLSEVEQARSGWADFADGATSMSLPDATKSYLTVVEQFADIQRKLEDDLGMGLPDSTGLSSEELMAAATAQLEIFDSTDHRLVGHVWKHIYGSGEGKRENAGNRERSTTRRCWSSGGHGGGNRASLTFAQS